MEVVEVGRRRRWNDEQKLRILERAAVPGISVRSVAREHHVAPSQIYDWRKKFVEAAALAGGGFAAVVVSSPDEPAEFWAGRMEVRCRNGRTITMGRDVDVAVLAKLVAMLDQ
jgi:transposase